MSNNPIADERAYWHAQLGIVDDGSLSLADLRNKTAGAVHANRAAVAGDAAGLNYLTQSQADARYSQLANAIPLSSSTPIVAAKNGSAGTEAAASHGDHVHPLGPVRPTLIYKTGGVWVTPRKTNNNTQFNTLNRVYLSPYPLFTKDWRNIVISALGVRCTTGQATSHVRVGLYGSLATGEPDMSAVLAAVDIVTTGTGDLSASLGSNLTLPPGNYWGATCQQGAVATLDAADSNTGFPPVWAPDTSGMTTPQALGVNSVTGALPTGAVSFTTAGEPMANIFMQLV